MGISKLKDLKEIQGNIAKVNFVRENKDDKAFISALRFLLDPLITTKISRTKWDKTIAVNNPDLYISNINDLLNYLQKISGKNSEVAALRYIFNNNIAYNVKEIVAGLINKDYVTGFGDKMWNEVFPEDKISVVSYLGCQSYSNKKLENLLKKNKYLFAELKNDGQFLFAFCYQNKIVFRTRQGLEQEIQGILVDTLLKIRNTVDYDFVLSGELLIKDYPNRDAANGILRGLSASNIKIIEGDTKEDTKFLNKNGISIIDVESRLNYVVWDLIPMNEYRNGIDNTPYNLRREKLSNILSDSQDIVTQTEGIIVSNKQEIFEYFYSILDKGLEGIVLKSPNTIFKDGKPVDQLKFKIEFNCELKVIGFEKGKVASKFENTLGSLICQSEDGLLITGVSGFKEIKKLPTDITRDEIWNNQEDWLGKIITVKCNGISTNSQGGYSLRYANYKLDRSHEKNKADTLSEIQEIEKSIIELGVK